MPNGTPGALVAVADTPPIPLGPRVPLRIAARIRNDPPAALAAVALAAIVLAALLAPWIAPFDPARTLDIAAGAQPPSAANWFGTDALSRDLLSRLLYGARLSLGIAVLGVTVATVVGTAWGAAAGYAGGWTDRVLMHVVDSGLAIPRILLLLGVVAFFGTLTMPTLVLVIGLTGWFGASRLVRAQVRAAREQEFTHAARAAGATPLRILVRHVLPHALTPMLVFAALGVGQVIVIEAGLSFLGYGVAPPAASWGSLIREGRDLLTSAWWLSVFPGAALAVTVLAINVLSDRLRAALGAPHLHAP